MSRAANRIFGASDLARVTRSIAVAGAVAKVQVTARGVDDEHQHWQPYGFGSAPLPGAQAIRLAPGSQRDDMIAVMVDDRRYRPAFAGGEAGIWDDQGQGVMVRRARIEIGTIGSSMGAIAKDADVVTLDAGIVAWLDGLALKAGYAVTRPDATGTIAATAKAVVE